MNPEEKEVTSHFFSIASREKNHSSVGEFAAHVNSSYVVGAAASLLCDFSHLALQVKSIQDSTNAKILIPKVPWGGCRAGCPESGPYSAGCKISDIPVWEKEGNKEPN